MGIMALLYDNVCRTIKYHREKHMTASGMLTHFPIKAQIIIFLITQVSHSVYDG